MVANRDGKPLSYTQFQRVWKYIVTRSNKERTYVRYVNGQKIKHTVTPALGEKAPHNGKKGATFYAVSASVNKILGALVAAYDSVATVSSMMHGEYGIEDVCISTMTIIGPNGVKGKVPVELTYDEQAKLRASADALKEVIASLDI